MHLRNARPGMPYISSVKMGGGGGQSSPWDYFVPLTLYPVDHLGCRHILSAILDDIRSAILDCHHVRSTMLDDVIARHFSRECYHLLFQIKNACFFVFAPALRVG